MTGSSFSFLPLGAVIQEFKVNGVNIVQGFHTQDQYAQYNSPFFGETIGRVANRIAHAKFKTSDDKEWQLQANNGPNCLHGGQSGWGKKLWKGPNPVGTRQIPGVEGLKGGESVEFTYVSEDGDEGFPGAVEVSVVYTTGTTTKSPEGKEVVVLGIEFQAKLVGGADETPINMTNHSYFNLTGDPTTEGTVITLGTNKHLPVNDAAIPTGGLAPWPSFDPTEPFTMTATEPEVDHCFISIADPKSVPLDTREEALRTNLTAYHPKTGIHLEVLSTEPGFQFYTGEFTSVPAVEDLTARGKRSAFCCEPSRYINAINVDEWKHMVTMKKGQTYGARIVYKGWSD